MDVRRQTFKESTIINAFKKSGCWPVNPNVFTDKDFALSIATSTSSLHVPNSFPRIPVQPEHDDHDPSVPNSDEPSDSEGSDSPNRSADKCTRPDSTQPDTNLVLAVLPPSHLTAPPFTATSTPLLPPVLPLSESELVSPSMSVPTRSTHSSARRASYPASGRVHTPSLQSLQEDNTNLQAHVTALVSRIAAVEAHATLAYTEIQALKRQLNTKVNKSNKRRKLNIDARWLNSDEGLRIAQEQEVSRAVEEQRRREAREQRTAKLAEREEQHQQRDPNEPFTGALATKTKGDLQDIAQALELAITGQKKDLLARINSHFDDNPLLRENPRFEGIFHQLHRQLGPAENHPPQDPPPPTPSDSSPAPPTTIPTSSSMPPPPWPVYSYLPFAPTLPPHNFGPFNTFQLDKH
ncbi:hypothetical protein EDB83DRAFT_2513084 [Lactarius deliciosus]|nr:hypothetical protein EDB83DRAFT_2513084 [Lactarius deliciosus]